MAPNLDRLRLEWRDYERGHFGHMGDAFDAYGAMWDGLTPLLEDHEPPAWSPTHVLFVAILLHQELEIRALRDELDARAGDARAT